MRAFVLYQKRWFLIGKLGSQYGKKIPTEALVDLKRRIDTLPPRSIERRNLMRETAESYGISEKTLYRLCQKKFRPSTAKRSDYGIPRITHRETMELYCEVIAAIRVKTTNKKGRHLSTSESIRLIEEFGVQTESGFVRAEAKQFVAGKLSTSRNEEICKGLLAVGIPI